MTIVLITLAAVCAVETIALVVALAVILRAHGGEAQIHNDATKALFARALLVHGAAGAPAVLAAGAARVAREVAAVDAADGPPPVPRIRRADDVARALGQAQGVEAMRAAEEAMTRNFELGYTPAQERTT